MASPVSHLVSVVSPGAKLHLTGLVIEGEPRDVNLAGRLEDARRNVGAHTFTCDNNVCRICTIKSLISTAKKYSYDILFSILLFPVPI